MHVQKSTSASSASSWAALAEVGEAFERCNRCNGEMSQFWLCSSSSTAKGLEGNKSLFPSWVLNRKCVNRGSAKIIFVKSLNYP